MRILILGGTSGSSRARGASGRQARLQTCLSLAGRTSDPRPPPIPMRIGGFGGVEGLRASWRRSGSRRWSTPRIPSRRSCPATRPRPARRPACRCSPCAARRGSRRTATAGSTWRPCDAAVHALGGGTPPRLPHRRSSRTRLLRHCAAAHLSRAHHRARRRCAAGAERDRHPRPRRLSTKLPSAA